MRMLLVEDDAAIVASLTDLLRSEGYETRCADGQDAAVELLRSERFDLALVDVALAQGNGFAVCAAAKACDPAPAVIFLTASDDEFSTVAGLDMGADDYIAKPFRARELLSRIRSVLRRTNAASSLLRLGDVEIDAGTACVRKAGRDLALTALEYRLLLLFAQSRGKLVTREHVRNAIWDSAGEYVSDNTLSVYVKRLRDKVEDDPAEPRLILTVRGLGYRTGARHGPDEEPGLRLPVGAARGGACRLRRSGRRGGNDPRAGLWVLAAGALACALFATFSLRRYRQIARLASEVDEVLHGGRRIAFSDYREGDLAVLRNELAKMVAALRTATERLDAEKNALADALADVSHQIRTPLTAMGLLIGTAERTSDEAERIRALHELETLVSRVGWLVTALLKLAKADAGAIRVQARPVDAARLVRDALAPLAGAFDLRDVACETHVDEGASFNGDAAWSAEALGNILKNCMEHTPAGGCVRVQASEDAVAFRLSVADLGIAAGHLPRLFERFYRGAGSEGFGIGLALAQALVTAQGGTLRAGNDRETGGARFDLTFPKVVV